MDQFKIVAQQLDVGHSIVKILFERTLLLKQNLPQITSLTGRYLGFLLFGNLIKFLGEFCDFKSVMLTAFSENYYVLFREKNPAVTMPVLPLALCKIQNMSV